MSEHVWASENLAAYLAGGLEVAERERLEQHAAGCAECARALAEGQAFDRLMEMTFTKVRPTPELEDRMIRSLRSASRGLKRPVSLAVRFVASMAALLVLGVLGMVVGNLVAQGELPFP